MPETSNLLKDDQSIASTIMINKPPYKWKVDLEKHILVENKLSFRLTAKVARSTDESLCN